MTAAEIAADSSNRKGERGRQEMKEGFFFNRVDVFTDQASVYEANEFSFLVFSNMAYAASAFLDSASVVAEGALNNLFFFVDDLVECCLFHCLVSNCDFGFGISSFDFRH